MKTYALGLLCATYLVSCGAPLEGDGTGTQGTPGPQGPQGPQGPAGLPAKASGSRLKLHVVVGADGSRFPFRIWDSERKEVCRFEMAEDGKTRCLPSDSAYESRDGRVFSDAGCNDPVFRVNPDWGPPRYARENLPMFREDGGPRFYALTEIFTTTVYNKYSDGTCKGMPSAPYRWYRGKPVLPTEFVAGEVQQEFAGDR